VSDVVCRPTSLHGSDASPASSSQRRLVGVGRAILDKGIQHATALGQEFAADRDRLITLRGQIGELVISHVENLRWATCQSLDQTFIRFGSSLDERLAATIEATQGAIKAALAKRREHAEAVAQEVARLSAAEAELSRGRTSLEQEATV